MTENGLVPIGGLARRAGAAASALRHYERVAEIGRLLAGRGRGGRDWGRLAEREIAELDARIADAQRAKEPIAHALGCPHRDPLACPNFRSALELSLERPGSQHR